MAWALRDPGFAAGPGRAQAQQPDDIGAVAVEVLALVGAVPPHSRRRWQSLVPDVGEHVGVAVLLDGLAEQPTQARGRRARSGASGQPVDGEPPQPDESRPTVSSSLHWFTAPTVFGQFGVFHPAAHMRRGRLGC